MNVSAADLARWLVEQSKGDPADALSAMAVVTAEFLKAAPIPERTKDTYFGFVVRAMALPSTYIEAIDEGSSGNPVVGFRRQS